MNYCPQCRSPLDPGARFCVNCGHTLPAQGPSPVAGPRPFAGQPAPYTPPPQQGYGPPPGPPQQGYAPPAGPPPSPYGAPPGAPPGYGGAPGGYGAPPPGGVPPGMPPGVPMASAVPADEGSGMKVLGGCGIAGCIGVVIAALLCVGLIAVLIIAGGSSSSTAGGGGGTPSTGGGSTDIPSNGSVRDLIKGNVGSYTLVGTSPLDKVPPGVIDSVGAVYSAPDGTRVFHVLLVYSSESVAKERIESVWRTSLSDAKVGEKVSRGNVTDSQGNVHGTMISCTNVNPESFYWNNRKLVAIVSGPPPHGKGFESNAPY